jgi:hypothetical protein
MISLLSEVLEAHGGLERWQWFTTLSATIVTGGEFWSFKGLVQDTRPRRMTVALHREWGSVYPFGDPDWRTDFTPDRIAIVARDGTTIAERADPGAAFTGHTLTTPWDPLHRAYFNGYALWTYMTTPFVLAEPELKVAEIAPVREGAETWRGLRATFPDRIATPAASRSSTSRPMDCSAVTTIMWTWPAALPPRSSSRDSSRHRDCAFLLDGALTSAAPTCARSPTL